MARISETIQVKIGVKIIDVLHSGIKPYKNWPKESQEELKRWVQETFEKGDTEGWIPFANFEASASFNIKKK